MTTASHPLFERFAPRIAALPARERYTRDELLVPDFLLREEGRLAIYYAPFDWVNSGARVALVGITPGFRQMEIAHREARRLLLAGGLTTREVLELVKYAAAFGGSIRHNLVAMLDGIGLPAALGIETSRELWAERHDLLHVTAAVRHPVFVGGADWTGHTPPVRSNALLRDYVRGVMLEELHSAAGALIVTLGRCAEEAVRLLSDEGALDPARCLVGLPHPSGANGHRKAQFARARDDLSRQVAAWFGVGGRVEGGVAAQVLVDARPPA